MSTPTTQQKAVMDRVENIGPAKCGICKTWRADCVEIKIFWIFKFQICDGCGAWMLKMFKRNIGGNAQ